MDQMTLEIKVKNRANERVQERISVFKRELRDSLSRLIKNASGVYHKDILSVMASDNDSKGWPSKLWEAEEKAVMDEVLSTMDSMQRILVSRSPKEDDCKPEETPAA